jgi:poly-gamma-glutamate capsule biosynthesis protein CapA/YwtB (metallophosphatase superfamily)
MSSGEELTLLLVGDVFVQRDNPPSVFRHVRELFHGADFLFGNLEGSVSDSGSPWSLKETNWKADARQIGAVEAGGFHAMSVANNHMLDFGYDALFETLGHLDRLGIAHTGGGHDFAEAHRPAIVERKGCRVALLGYTSVFMPDWAAGEDIAGLAVMRAHTAYEPPRRVNEVPGMPPTVRSWLASQDKAQLAVDIAATRRQADIVVCAFHWGVSRGYQKIAEYQAELGRHAIECGADVVFGHHPHVIQGVEMYRDRPIFYSLGNFTFAQHNPAKGHEAESMIVRCRIRDRHITSVELLPTRIDEKLDPHVLDGEAGRPVVELIRQRSNAFATRFEADGGAVKVLPAAAAEPT